MKVTMAHPRSIFLAEIASLLFFCTTLMAQDAAPAVRILGRIDESQMVTLKGTVHPLATAANDAARRRRACNWRGCTWC